MRWEETAGDGRRRGRWEETAGDGRRRREMGGDGRRWEEREAIDGYRNTAGVDVRRKETRGRERRIRHMETGGNDRRLEMKEAGRRREETLGDVDENLEKNGQTDGKETHGEAADWSGHHYEVFTKMWNGDL